MKSISKLICLFLTMSIFITMSGYAAQNHTAYINENGEVIETGIDIIVDGAALDFSGVHEPVIIDGRTLIPMRKLFETEEERKEFFDRHGKDVARRKDISTANGPVFLGLDVGSTTIKAALINEDGDILYDYYGKTKAVLLPAV